WLNLNPNPDVVIFGNESGTDEFTAEHPEIIRIKEAKTNHLGTPLVSDLFKRTSRIATTDWVAFVNGDIILPSHLPEVLDRIAAQTGPCLMACRRWNADVNELVDFSDADWFQKLIESRPMALYPPVGMDFFVFPKGTFDHMPDFSIGWPGAKYDNWLIRAGKQLGIPVVDITAAVQIIHQNHPAGGGASHPEKLTEHRINLKLLGGYGYCYDIQDADYYCEPDAQVTPRPLDPSRIPLWIKRIIQRIRDAFIL
ncbi:hypothetical protein EBR96_00850, partial [bacterium]|nr:hypothetical protein [bacterium]